MVILKDSLQTLGSDIFGFPFRKTKLIVRHNKTCHRGELLLQRLELKLSPQLSLVPLERLTCLQITDESHVLADIWLSVVITISFIVEASSLWTSINIILLRFIAWMQPSAGYSAVADVKKSAKALVFEVERWLNCGWRDVRVFGGIQCRYNISWLSLPHN